MDITRFDMTILMEIRGNFFVKFDSKKCKCYIYGADPFCYYCKFATYRIDTFSNKVMCKGKR